MSTESTTTTTTTLTAGQLAAGQKLATAATAMDAADRSFRDAMAAALPAVADRYVQFVTAVRGAVVALGVAVDSTTFSDKAARGKAVREAVKLISADAVGEAASVRELLDSLTGVGAARGSQFSRAANIAAAIGKADGSGARLSDVKLFASLHADRDDIVIGVAKLATWCASDDRTVALPNTAGTRGGGDSSDAGTTTTTTTTDSSTTTTTDSTTTPPAPMTLLAAIEAVHRGQDDSTLEAVIAAAPVDIAAIADDVRAALLSALLASAEMIRRADIAVGAAASDPLAALVTVK